MPRNTMFKILVPCLAMLSVCSVATAGGGASAQRSTGAEEGEGTDKDELIRQYNAVCDSVTEMVESEKYQEAGVDESRMMYRKAVVSSFDAPEIRATFTGLAHTPPHRKHEMMQRAVHKQTGEEWSCPALEKVR